VSGLSPMNGSDYRIFVSSSIIRSNRNSMGRHPPADMRQHKQSLKDEPVFFYLLLLLAQRWKVWRYLALVPRGYML
ncbi:GM24956, partial [Drosophila sechellia]